MWYLFTFIGTVLGWALCAICSANRLYSNNELADNWRRGFDAGYMDGYSTASKHYEEKIRSMYEQD